MSRLSERIRNTIYIKCNKFFRWRLLTSSPERIMKIVDGYDKEIEAIRQDVLKMCWSMRGGLTYEEALNLSFNERKLVGNVVKDNLETTKKSGLPFF